MLFVTYEKDESLHEQANASTITAVATDGSFGTYLRSLRERRGLTLREVEAASGGHISNGYLSQIESGRRPAPSPKLLSLVASIYGVPTEVIFEKAGYVSPPTPTEVEVAFEQVLADRNFQFGTRLKGDLDDDAKRVIIELYEQVTHKKLLPNADS